MQAQGAHDVRPLRVGTVNLTDFVACLLFEASLGIPFPEFWRHTKARKHLMMSLRAT